MTTEQARSEALLHVGALTRAIQREQPAEIRRSRRIADAAIKNLCDLLEGKARAARGERYVSNDRFRLAAVEAVQSGRLSWSEMARRSGLMRSGGGRTEPTPDVTVIRRRLGVIQDDSKGRYRKNISVEWALRLIDVLGFDPVDFDL